jgi:IclR family transcriptional regulator, pca regulon regulatory protein
MASPQRRIDQPQVKREFVKGLERGFAVLKAFSARTPSLTITQVAARTGLTRAVARRYLFTLEALGYVVHHDSAFALTPLVLELGFTYLSSMSVADIARPFMVRIVEQLRESCSVAVFDRQEIVYIARVQADRIMTNNLVVGSRLPAHATAMGKVLLAHLSPTQLDEYFAVAQLRPLTDRTIHDEPGLRAALAEVRRRGWAANDEESERGLRTVAVPIVERDGRVIAAMNVSAHASRVSTRELRRDHLPVLLAAAAEISRALGAGVVKQATHAPSIAVG